jgi:uncharacterized protein
VSLPRRIVIFPIAAWHAFIAPLFGARCKYEPSCSTYAIQAIERYGILRGVVLAGWRILRCNPGSHGGFDPVEAQRLFGARAVTDRAP